MSAFGPFSAWYEAVLKEFYFCKICGFKSLILHGNGPGPGPAALKIIFTVDPELAFD